MWLPLWLPRFCLGLVLCAMLACGCASTPYGYGRFHPDKPDGTDVQPLRVDHGRPNAALDALGWTVGLPGRVLTMNKKVNNHKVSDRTLARLQTYLELNDITDVHVAVNDYDPAGQWRRLRANRHIGPFWRYTAGSLTWLGYTIFPRRVFGGDKYNPFTNSLIITSDVPALVMAQGGYAKDVRSRKWRGLYAVLVNDLPVLSVLRQVKASRDVLGYARDHEDLSTERDIYHTLYPHIGADLFSTGGHFIPVIGPLMHVAGALAGHAAGSTVAVLRARELRKELPADKHAPGDFESRQEMAKRVGEWEAIGPVKSAEVVTPAAFTVDSSERTDCSVD